MNARRNLIILLATSVFLSCGKSDDSKNGTHVIDVSAQWQIDVLGNLMAGSADGQWKAQAFTNEELGLFANLDTADLAGTESPTAVVEDPPSYIFPNPFNSRFLIQFGFNPGFSGEFVFKSVIVDSLMNPLDKIVVRMQASDFGNVSYSHVIAFAPNLPVGRFRIYYTLSSQANKNFYKSWGNIQRN